jgi:hypothetical protein
MVGLNDYARRRARELAQLGCVALAVDVYGGGREAADSTEAGTLMNGLFADMAATGERVKAAIEQLRVHPLVDPTRIGAMGYCLGGALSLHAARLGLDLKGVASFHGSLGRTHEAKKGEFKRRGADLPRRRRRDGRRRMTSRPSRPRCSRLARSLSSSPTPVPSTASPIPRRRRKARSSVCRWPTTRMSTGSPGPQ